MNDDPAQPRPSRPDQSVAEVRKELVLAALPTAVNVVGLFVRATFADMPADTAHVQRVETVAKYLAGHAVATTGVRSAAPLYRAEFDDLHAIVARLRITRKHTVVEMWDRSVERPSKQLGRSNTVLHPDTWSYAFPDPGIRVVWCAVAADSSPRPAHRTSNPPDP